MDTFRFVPLGITELRIFVWKYGQNTEINTEYELDLYQGLPSERILVFEAVFTRGLFRTEIV